MKVTKLVEFEPMEVDVSIDTEDIIRALDQEPDTPGAAFRLLNQAASCMGAISDDLIAQMKPQQLEIIANFLKAQAARFCQ